MRFYLLAAAAAVAVASPAAARDGSGYFGVEGGILFPNDSDLDISATVDGDDLGEEDDALSVDFKNGYDVDLIAGYDLGLVRLEAELGYKRAKGKDLEVDSEFDEFFSDDDLEIDGKTTVWSVMGNALLDFGDDAGFSGYIGGGLGYAGVKAFGETDGSWAWQGIAGVRTAISDNIDLGLKYRYFRTGRLHYDVSTVIDDGDGGTFDVDLDARTHFSSHSLLASLIFNFGAPAAPPPPPPPPPPPVEAAPPPPATQTCPDGTVIMAAEACPAPPPPPPPPPPAPERG